MSVWNGRPSDRLTAGSTRFLASECQHESPEPRGCGTTRRRVRACLPIKAVSVAGKVSYHHQRYVDGDLKAAENQPGDILQ